jgi:hypothetical protein
MIAGQQTGRHDEVAPFGGLYLRQAGGQVPSDLRHKSRQVPRWQIGYSILPQLVPQGHGRQDSPILEQTKKFFYPVAWEYR